MLTLFKRYKKELMILIGLLLTSYPLASLADMNSVNTPIKGTVALTFDDGPHPVYTKQILDILKKYKIKATFFMVGKNMEKYPEIVKMVVAEGHAVNNHSLTHPLLTNLNDTDLHKEIMQPCEMIKQLTGKRPTCLRYPFNASNEHVRDLIRKCGMTPTSMGFNSYDYSRPGEQKIVDQIVEHAYNQMVVLLHDGFDKREQTVAALPKIIEGLQKKGYSFSQICKNSTG